MVKLKTKIGNLTFETPIFNASGCWCTTKDELEDLGKSEAGAIVFKTATLKSRKGNPKPRLYIGEKFSINSMGLPNLGVNYYCQIASVLKKYHKPLFISLAGFTEDEFINLYRKVSHFSFEAIEINLSCPNLEGKSIFAYDFKVLERILKKIIRLKKDKIIGVKLPPFLNRGDIFKLIDILITNKIDFVTLINSVPLGFYINEEKETTVIKPNLGVGGLGGELIKPISLAQVYLFHRLSQGKLKIIGVGGVKKGVDVYQYILAGASAVGVGTTLLKEGPKIFLRLKKELIQILDKKKIADLSEKIGKVKII